MVDSEIIKALEERMYCGKWIGKGFLDKKDFLLFKDAISLITRQKAEIEKVKSIYNSFEAELKAAKSETRREFAERLKEIASQGFWESDSYVGMEQIDNLLKEMER